jgi:hypothetical protein
MWQFRMNDHLPFHDNAVALQDKWGCLAAEMQACTWESAVFLC